MQRSLILAALIVAVLGVVTAVGWTLPAEESVLSVQRPDAIEGKARGL